MSQEQSSPENATSNEQDVEDVDEATAELLKTLEMPSLGEDGSDAVPLMGVLKRPRRRKRKKAEASAEEPDEAPEVSLDVIAYEPIAVDESEEDDVEAEEDAVSEAAQEDEPEPDASAAEASDDALDEDEPTDDEALGEAEDDAATSEAAQAVEDDAADDDEAEDDAAEAEEADEGGDAEEEASTSGDVEDREAADDDAEDADVDDADDDEDDADDMAATVPDMPVAEAPSADGPQRQKTIELELDEIDEESELDDEFEQALQAMPTGEEEEAKAAASPPPTPPRPKTEKTPPPPPPRPKTEAGKAGPPKPPRPPKRPATRPSVPIPAEQLEAVMAGGMADQGRDLTNSSYEDNGWYKEVFNETYLRILPTNMSRQTNREVRFVEKQLGLAEGAVLLDLCCGFGRHTIELAQRGYEMVGLDLSMPLLQKALQDAQARNLRIKFVHGDMRDLKFERVFDGIVNLGTSFGYFDDQKNFLVLKGMYRALKPGGRLLIELMNRDFIVEELPTRIWWQGDRCLVLEEIDFEESLSLMKMKRSIVFEDGSRPPWEQYINVRLYSPHELMMQLRRAGFDTLELSGDFAHPGIHFGATSQRAIVLAERPES